MTVRSEMRISAATVGGVCSSAEWISGRLDGPRVWLDILEKVKELQRVEPGSGEPVH